MKYTLQALILLLIITGCSGTQQTVSHSQTSRQIKTETLNQTDGSNLHTATSTEALLSFQDEITVDFLRSHLKVFAHDTMKGRETGTPALKKAAHYLAGQYKKMGLQPVGVNDSYLQPFNLTANVTDSIVFVTYKNTEEDRRVVNRSVNSKTSSGSYLRNFWGTDTLDAPIVFAGFGVVDSSHNVNNLGDMDLQDKWVMIFQEMPNTVNGDTVINPQVDARSRFRTLLENRGATKILVVPDIDMNRFNSAAEQSRMQFGQKSQMRLTYLEDDEGNEGSNRGYDVISPQMAAEILGLSGADKLDAFKHELIENITDFRPYATGYSLRHIPYSREVTFESQNVAAFLEGSDPELKNQVVVLTSHYDHVGIGRPDSTGDAIYNGADDDGSGTIGLLNAAHAFAAARDNGIHPRRSILFLNVAAEEKGLLGSRYYSDHPIFPIKNTVANINVDMIGRIDAAHEEKGITDYAYIIGGSLISSGLDSLLQVANRQTGKINLSARYNDLNDPNQFYRRSDHWNFGRLGVPFVFFFTGVHEDYHRPGDEVDKIRFEKMAKIVRTIYGTAILVANSDERPKVDNQAFIKKTQE